MYLRRVIRLFTYLVLLAALINSLSLSMQQVYRDYFCDDTKAYLTIAGRAITVCGKTCDFEFEKAEKSAETPFSFNMGAPPLYFQETHDLTTQGRMLQHSLLTPDDLYQYLLVRGFLQPPQG